jgi:hypothetical protein
MISKVSAKFLVVSTIFLVAIALNSCKKCYTCQANQFDNRIDFNKECGSEQEKQQMEIEFRKQYPDSLYFVTCD